MLPYIQRLFCIPPTSDCLLPLNGDNVSPKYNAASCTFCIPLTTDRLLHHNVYKSDHFQSVLTHQ